MSLLSQTLRRSTLQLHLLPSRSALVALSPRLPSSHHSRFYATPSSPSPSTSTSTPSAASSPPPNTPISLQGKGVQEEVKHENAKLFSKQDTLSYRDLLLIFSETITQAFNTPYTPATSSSKNIGDYTESLKRPGLKIMEDPGTFVMVERIRDAGIAEGMELEAVNQHILSILDSIAPPPEEAVYTNEQRKTEAEEELKEAVEKVHGFKEENKLFLQSKPPYRLNSLLPFGLGDKLNARALHNRNNNDVRILRLINRIMDCGFESGRDPKEMSLLLKYSYFPPNQPPPHAIAPDGKVISAGDEDKDTGTPIMESRSWPGMLQIGHSRENKHKR